MIINSAKDLDVYKRAYALSMEIFNILKKKHFDLASEATVVGKMLGSINRKHKDEHSL